MHGGGHENDTLVRVSNVFRSSPGGPIMHISNAHMKSDKHYNNWTFTLTNTAAASDVGPS